LAYLAPFEMYGDLKVKMCHFSAPNPDLMPSLGVILSANCQMKLASPKIGWWGYPKVKTSWS